MALPSSGQISASDIRTELGISVTDFSILTARNSGYVPINPYSPSVPKTTGDARYSDWYSYCHTCTPLYTHTIWYLSPHANREGFDTKDNACAHSGVSATFYSSSSTLSVGSSLYYLSGGVYYPATFSQYGGTGGIWIYNSSVGAIRMTSSSSNVIAEIQSCPTAGRMLITFSKISVGDVCTASHQELLWYDQSYGFTTGAVIYTNGTLTTPYSNPNAWTYASILYVDGGNGYIYNFSGNTVGSYTGIFC